MASSGKIGKDRSLGIFDIVLVYVPVLYVLRRVLGESRDPSTFLGVSKFRTFSKISRDLRDDLFRHVEYKPHVHGLTRAQENIKIESGECTEPAREKY